MKVKGTNVVTNPPMKKKAMMKSHCKSMEKLKEEDIANPEPMQVEISCDPWDDTNIRALFLPNANEYPKDAIA